MGLLAGLASRPPPKRLWRPAVMPPATALEVLGALVGHITGGHLDGGKGSFQPMNINYGLLPPLEDAPRHGEDGKRLLPAKEGGRGQEAAGGRAGPVAAGRDGLGPPRRGVDRPA